jgi:hypothetical protein
MKNLTTSDAFILIHITDNSKTPSTKPYNLHTVSVVYLHRRYKMQLLRCLPFLSLLVGSCKAFVVSSPSRSVHQGMSMSASTSVDMDETTPISYLEKGDLDTEALLAKSTFAIKPDDLIAVAKDFVFIKGSGTKDKGESLADDFIFRAAFIETPKDKFIETLKGFNLEDSFEIKQQFFGWTVDPLQPNRVWVINRQESVHTGDFVGVKPTGKNYVLPPQSLHFDFQEDGKCTEFGFYTVDRNQGNTGGLGGVFGLFYGVGRALPIPEGKPYEFSLQRRVLEGVTGFFSKFSKKN